MAEVITHVIPLEKFTETVCMCLDFAGTKRPFGVFFQNDVSN